MEDGDGTSATFAGEFSVVRMDSSGWFRYIMVGFEPPPVVEGLECLSRAGRAPRILLFGILHDTLLIIRPAYNGGRRLKGVP